MMPPLLYVVSREADIVNGWRFGANLWDLSLPARRGRAPPAAPPASKCTRSRLDQRGALTRHNFSGVPLIPGPGLSYLPTKESSGWFRALEIVVNLQRQVDVVEEVTPPMVHDQGT